MSENLHSPEDWRQVSKGRRAVTHTDKRRVTPVRNQFQELSEHQEDPTPRLAPREIIAAFSRLPPEDDNDDDAESETGFTETGSIITIGRKLIVEFTRRSATDPSNSSSSSSSSSDDNHNNNDGDNSNGSNEDNNTDTGSFGSTESFDTMTDITNNYGSLMEIIRLVNAEQATVFSGKKKNYADIVKFREVLGSALSTQPCSGGHSGYSWQVDTEEDYTHRVGATTTYTVQSMPKGSSEYKRYTIDQQKYNKFLHWNTKALAALEHRFPNSLTPKRNKFEALPITYTIREAVDYLESLVNTDVEKRETYCAIVRDIY
jgi:hypothetical protein